MVPSGRLIAPLAALALLAGCGKTSASDQVRSTLAGYASAFAHRDYQAICDRYFAPKLVAGIEEHGLPCESAVRPAVSDASKPQLTVTSVRVKGDTAVARVHATAANQAPADQTITLVRSGGTWRLSAPPR
jgi:ketosteroid isomerase-like protein